MKARRGMLAAALGVLSLFSAAAWSLHRRAEVNEQDVVSRRQESLAQMSAGNMRRLESVRHQLVEADKPARVAHESSAAARTALLHSAKVLQASSRMIDRSEVHQAELEGLCADADTVALMRRVAVDLELARGLFGEEQAGVRVTAVRALAHLARNGHPEMVAGAVAELATKLNATETWEKGIQHDFTDLLESHVRSLDKAEILRDPDAFFRSVGLSARTRVHVAQALHAAQFYRELAPDELATLRQSYGHFVPQGG